MARLHLYCKHEFYSRLSKIYRQLPIIGVFFDEWDMVKSRVQMNQKLTQFLRVSAAEKAQYLSSFFNK